MKDRTIAAISTPRGKGGIAVIRISGDEAISVAELMFRTRSGIPLSEQPSNRAVYGDILYRGEVIDDGLAVIFRAPHSYTGEDTVEISCHGGILLADKVLESAFLSGASQAEAGEFTRRAFLSGRLGLSQAEAVIDLIDARSSSQIELALGTREGRLSESIDELYSRLSDLISSIYVDIDYPEEGLSGLGEGEAEARMRELRSALEALASTYRLGSAVGEGIPVCIVGKPNTGKSSLLNLLLGDDRAIVTSVAGTTRDVIEETLTVGRIMLRISDTAGIRDSENEVEQMGIERSKKKLSGAQLCLAVFDGSRPADEEDAELLRLLEGFKARGGELLTVVNKLDLLDSYDGDADETAVETSVSVILSSASDLSEMAESSVGRIPSPNSDARCASPLRAFLSDNVGLLGMPVYLSAATGAGKQALLDRITALYDDGKINLRGDAVVSNSRQYADICTAVHHIDEALSSLAVGMTEDVAGTDLELALSALGSVDGRTVTEDVVNGIFSRFCVGK